MDDIDRRESADQTVGTRPARAPYLSPDADVHSVEFASFVDAGDQADSAVFTWLRQRVSDTNAVKGLSLAAHDFVSWLAANGGKSPLTVTVGCEGSRVLITLQDHGSPVPDLNRSRLDVAKVYRVLGPNVVEWGCDPDDAGTRTVRIYGDTTAPRTASAEEWPQ